MKLPCIKVTVKLGYEAYFIALCKSLRVDCRQYPTEALKNRFSVKARKKDFIGCDCVLIVEDMPVVTAN